MSGGVFAQLGKPLFNGSASLTSATPATLFTPVAGAWTDIYSITITTNETAVRTVTISDGATNILYYVGGAASGANPPIVDQGSIPVRFKMGTAITATASGVTASTTIAVNIRGLVSKT